jgi:predicted enzyme related to lactoylglutathione lyase
MPHGKICYLEIPANAAQASADFYAQIFGWKVRPRGDGNLAFDDSGSVSGTWVKAEDRTPEERTRVRRVRGSSGERVRALRGPRAS